MAVVAITVCRSRGPAPEWLYFALRPPDRLGGGSSHTQPRPGPGGGRQVLGRLRYGQNILQQAIRQRHLRVYQRERETVPPCPYLRG